MTDIAFAVTDSELFSELGWNIWDKDRKLEDGLFSEGIARNEVEKYESEELINAYNHYVFG